MSPQLSRRALVVRGGGGGPPPHEATERFIPFRKDNDFAVAISEDLDVYLDAELLAETDLIVQCWSMGQARDEQGQGLPTGVQAGTGLAGWHGGICDSFRTSAEYLQLVGGQFATHPDGVKEHEIVVSAERADHPIVSGLTRWTQTTEQYWVLSDAL